METLDFLETALPRTGYLCAVGIKNGAIHHKFADNINSLLEQANALTNDEHDTYFALHSFDAYSRTQGAAVSVRSFYLDIDCGADKAESGKGYETKGDAIQALIQFVKTFKLPKPYIIDSGRGLHVYWMLEDDVQKKVWQPVANALKRAALSSKLLIDPAVPADSARILRVPGSYNYKDRENPLSVLVLQQGAPVPFERMKEAFAKYESPVVDKRPARMDATTRALTGDFESSFNRIANSSLRGVGCAQVAYYLKHKEEQSYDMWLALLSIAARCVEKNAIHKLSEGHPGYDFATTEAKAQEAGDNMGPRTCAWFKHESGEGARCESCLQKITSPIQLGKMAVEAPVEVVHTHVDEHGEESKVVETLDLPDGYSRTISGAIVKQDKESGGSELVSDYEIVVLDRVNDPDHGDCAKVRVTLPHEQREFLLPMKSISSAEKFKDAMSTYGIYYVGKQLSAVNMYMTNYMRHLLKMRSAAVTRTQFGWADGDDSFIVGVREYTDRGVRHAPPSSATDALSANLVPTGDIDKWREAFDLYKDAKGCEPQVFALLSTFGAPIMKFTGVNGALISLVHSHSGTGKTTILQLINSVWGDPDKLILLQKDTTNAKQLRMGVLSCLPTTFDEMTNCKPEELSDLVYGVTHGRAKNRMRADANAERVNNTSWSTIAVSTGNASVVDKIASLKATSEGEQARIMEYRISLVEVPNAKEKLRNLDDNYGVAGIKYAAEIVRLRKSMRTRVTEMYDKIEKAAKTKAKERFWVWTAACIFVGAKLAKDLGLHSYDLDALFAWVCNVSMQSHRESMSSLVVQSDAVLGEYLNDNYDKILTIDAGKVNALTLSNVVKNPRISIAARFEADSQFLYVPKKDFRDYCVRRQVSPAEVLEAKNYEFVYICTEKKRMASGTGVTAPPIDVYKFKINDEDFCNNLKEHSNAGELDV